MLKMLQITVSLDVKGDAEDEEDLKARVYDKLQLLMEEDSLKFNVNADEEADDLGFDD